jgi:hypothetical protein
LPLAYNDNYTGPNLAAHIFVARLWYSCGWMNKKRPVPILRFSWRFEVWTGEWFRTSSMRSQFISFGGAFDFDDFQAKK